MISPWGSKGEERELLRLLSESALNDYPNPQRLGCPGDDFLHKVAYHRKLIPPSDPRLDHVVHCSPCFHEFKDFQAAATRERNRRWAAITTVAAVIVIGVALWIIGPFTGMIGPSRINTTPIIAQIDLQNRSITRGGPVPLQKNDGILVPRGRLRLTILLPSGSDEGDYHVQVLREIDKPLIASFGQAEVVEGVTKLSVTLNTSSLFPGKYLLGIRHPPLDWVFDPITVQ